MMSPKTKVMKLVWNLITITLITTTLYTLATQTHTLRYGLKPLHNHEKQTSNKTTLTLTSVQCSKVHYKHQRLTVLLLLLLCGDTGATLNPGPYQPKYPCVICKKAVKWGQRAIQCDSCGEGSKYTGWYHVSCMRSFTPTYEALAGNSVSWMCDNCGLPNFSNSFFSNSTIPLSNSYAPLNQNTTKSFNQHNLLTAPIHSTPIKANMIHKPDSLSPDSF